MPGDSPSNEDIQLLLCISLVVLVFFIGVATGRNLEKSYAIRVLHNQIEKLEATR